MPQTSSVAATARAQVGVALDDRRRRVIIASCAIDNLGKGAAAQAMQCANLLLGLPETQGIGATARSSKLIAESVDWRKDLPHRPPWARMRRVPVQKDQP